MRAALDREAEKLPREVAQPPRLPRRPAEQRQVVRGVADAVARQVVAEHVEVVLEAVADDGAPLEDGVEEALRASPVPGGHPRPAECAARRAGVCEVAR